MYNFLHCPIHPLLSNVFYHILGAALETWSRNGQPSRDLRVQRQTEHGGKQQHNNTERIFEIRNYVRTHSVQITLNYC